MIKNKEFYIQETMKYISKYFKCPNKGHTIYYRLNGGYQGYPKPIHLGVGDKFLILVMIRQMTSGVSEQSLSDDDPCGLASWIQHFNFDYISPNENY